MIMNTFSEVTLQDFSIPELVSEYTQVVFVEQRKQEFEASGGKEVKTTADTFHQWLTLARLMSVSEATLELTKELFDRARELEKQRLSRIPGTTASNKK